MDDPLEAFEILIERLKDRATMFFFPFTFNNLSIFINGYREALKNMKTSDPLNGFREWLRLKFHNFSCYSWDGLILLVANNDDESAKRIFFETFHEFWESKKEKGLEYILDAEKKMVDEHLKALT